MYIKVVSRVYIFLLNLYSFVHFLSAYFLAFFSIPLTCLPLFMSICHHIFNCIHRLYKIKCKVLIVVGLAAVWPYHHWINLSCYSFINDMGVRFKLPFFCILGWPHYLCHTFYMYMEERTPKTIFGYSLYVFINAL